MLLHSINQVRLSDRCEYVQVISQALQREQLPGDILQRVDDQYLEADGQIIPTSLFDLWQNKDPEAQWSELVSLWRVTSRVAGLVGRSESRNLTALSSELDRSNASLIRNLTLNLLLNNPGISASHESVKTAVLWRYPHRRGISITSELVQCTLREAEWLGITGGGALSPYGESLLKDEENLGINGALPKPVEHILVQADNTAQSI